METYEVLFKEGETTGVYGISLVNDPAMESLWVALSKEEQVQLKSIDNEKRIVCGAVLIPNKPIYRNQNGKEFNIVFPNETVRLASEGFLKNGYQNSSTLEHNIDAKLSNVAIVESWIKEDEVNDKSVKYGFNDPIGTWYASMKIDNEEIWNDYIKTGKVKGFSIDGFFDLEQIKMSKNKTTTGIDIWFDGIMLTKGKEVKDLNGNNLPDGNYELMTNVTIDVQNGIVTDLREVNLKNELNMSEQKSVVDTIISAIKDGFASLKLNKEEEKITLGSVNTADGSVKINFEGDTIMANLPVTMTAPDDSELPVPDGEYNLEGGMKITVLSGLVSEVSTVQEEAQDEEMPMNDQANLSEKAPQIKSEKVTQEVFYQLSKDDFKAMVLEFGNQIEKVKTELREEFEATLNKQTEVVELTKAKPAKEKSWEEMTPLERHRASKLN